jgi:hypothetical protein
VLLPDYPIVAVAGLAGAVRIVVEVAELLHFQEPMP